MSLRVAGQADRLAWQFRGFLRDHGRQLERLAARLTLDELQRRLARHDALLQGLAARQSHAGARRHREAEERLAALASRLASVSYESVLQRGFALVRDERAALVRDAEGARQAGLLELEFKDGRVRTLVAERPARRGAGERPAASQGRLL
jgi:exodeoxyribonuclease VII large subunit